MTRRLRPRAATVAVPLLLLAAAAWHGGRTVRQAQLDNELADAADAGDVHRVETALRRGADPDARYLRPGASTRERLMAGLSWRGRAPGASMLPVLCVEDQWAVVEALVRHGADVNARGPDGGTALHWAAERGRAELAALLLARGARIDARDAEGATPLMCAARSGRGRMVAWLLAGGARVDARDRQARTPLIYAAEESAPGAAACVRLLLKHGGDPTAADSLGYTASAIATTAPLRHLLLQAEADWRRKHGDASAQTPAE